MTLMLVKASEPMLAGDGISLPKPEASQQTMLPMDWVAVAGALGVAEHKVLAIAARAKSVGVLFQIELLALGIVSEHDFIRALAKQMGVGYLHNIRAEGLIITGKQSFDALGRQKGLPIVGALDRSGRCVLLLAPSQVDLAEITTYLKTYPAMVSKIMFVPAAALRQALMERGKGEVLQQAVGRLFDAFPQFSARTVLSGRQGVVFGLLLAGGFATLLRWPSAMLLGVHIVFSLCFFLCVALRLVAILAVRKQQPAVFQKAAKPEDMPVYTVLVALYKEADVVAELLMSLSRLVWPRSKLEIKLVCESDDDATLAAIQALELRSYIEVIKVPASLPRTKPKALSYALTLSSGDYVVIYDAEDRPHPNQLIEAWRRFREGGDDLACLQAPLVITNPNDGWLARMFAFEYSALFSGLLPWLSQSQLVLPLGGTSNHFRRAVLEEVGGWDPYNVTEDADLGIRLRRLGYAIQTITCPTYEDAPTNIAIWLPQRTRWFKGWLQTWLVHMRHPRVLLDTLGPASFVTTQVLFPCTIIAALSNILLVMALVVAVVWLGVTGSLPPVYGAMLLIDVANIVLGYGGFLAIGWLSLPLKERRSLWKYALMTPFYWIMLSLAAWRAVWQIYRRPHHWEKTPHFPRRAKAQRTSDDRSDVAAAQRKKPGPEPTSIGSASPMTPRSRWT